MRSVLSEKQEALNAGRAKHAVAREDILEISRHKMKDVRAPALDAMLSRRAHATRKYSGISKFFLAHQRQV